MFTRTLLATSAMALMIAGAAQAQTVDAMAATDLNLRAGPGSNYEIVGLIPASGAVTVESCLDVGAWCKVMHAGVQGWAASDYLTVTAGNAPVALATRPEGVTVTTVTRDDSAGAALAGAGAGAAAGAMVGGPVGALVGAAIGTVMLAEAVEPETVTYVTQNPVEPVYLDGEIVVGAGIPQEVPVYEVPGTERSYLYVNGRPVIIDRTNRQIIQIVR